MTTSRAVDGLPVDDASEVCARRSDQEAARLEQEPRLRQDRVGVPVARHLGQARAQTHQVERLLVRFVGDPEAASGIDQPKGRASRQREPPGGADSRRDVRQERRGVEDVRRPEGMESEQLEMWRRHRPSRRIREVRRIHPELARPVVADEADALESGMLGDGRPQENRLDPAGMRGDPLESCQLARRLDGDGADAGGDRGAELVVALARAGHHDAVRGDAGSAAPWRARRPMRRRRPSPRRPRKSTTRERRVRLDRVGELDPRPAGRHAGSRPAARRHRGRRRTAASRSDRRARRGRSRPSRPAREDLVACRRSSAPRAGLSARGSSEGSFERDPGRGAGIAILDQQGDRGGQPVLRGKRPVQEPCARDDHGVGRDGQRRVGCALQDRAPDEVVEPRRPGQRDPRADDGTADRRARLRAARSRPR